MWSFLASRSAPSRGNLYPLSTCSHNLAVCQPHSLIHAGLCLSTLTNTWSQGMGGGVDILGSRVIHS